MFTKIDLCSMALLKLGEKPIQSWYEDTASAQLARTMFDSTVDTLLAVFPWRFATKTLVLNKPENDDFIIPVDVLRILKCDGQINGNKIKASGNSVEITAVVKMEPESFPGYFANLLATKLALEFCIPLIGDSNVFKMISALYESEYQSAKFIDSTTSIQQNISDFSLIDSRF